jgi:hypothetical protein
MKRKTSHLPTRIYSYGCRLPTEGAQIIEEQLKLARVYHNKLLEIELARRAAVRTAMASCPDVATAAAAVAEIDQKIEAERVVIKAARQAARSGAVDVRANKERLKELFVQVKAARGALKAAKTASRTPQMLAKFKAAQEAANQAVRDARAVCGVYWGTYLLVEQEIEAARKSKTDPQFRRWTGTGRIGVELMHGLSVADLMAGKDTRLQIHMTPGASKRSQSMAVVRVRVGSAGRDPIWAALPFRLHRPLPADGRVKWAWIHRTFKGRWVNWDLQIVLEAGSFAVPERPAHDGGVVAIDLGWRARQSTAGDGSQTIRVGYWCDDRGQHGELVMPADLKGRLEHANSLRAIEDRNFDAAKARLMEWLKEHAAPEGIDLANLAAWKSAKRLGRTVSEWENLGEVPCDLLAWWKQHRHLYDWESSERARALNARKNHYRNIAAQLTTTYAVLVLEDFDMRGVVELNQPEHKEDDAVKPARRNRVFAAPSEFRLALKSAAPLRGCRVAELACALTTQPCHVCGESERWDAAKSVRHTCRNGHTWDQDYNAARNLLASYASGGVVTGGSPSGTPETEPIKQEALAKASQARVITEGCQAALATPAQGAVP